MLETNRSVALVSELDWVALRVFLVRFIKSQGFDDADAEDLAQEAMIELFKSLPKFDRNRDPAGYGLARFIAIRVIQWRRRKEQRRRRLLPPASFDEVAQSQAWDGQGPAERVEETDALEWLRQHIEELSTIDREVVEGLLKQETRAQTAQRLGISRDRLCARLVSLRRRMGQLMRRVLPSEANSFPLIKSVG